MARNPYDQPYDSQNYNRSNRDEGYRDYNDTMNTNNSFGRRSQENADSKNDSQGSNYGAGNYRGSGQRNDFSEEYATGDSGRSPRYGQQQDNYQNDYAQKGQNASNGNQRGGYQEGDEWGDRGSFSGNYYGNRGRFGQGSSSSHYQDERGSRNYASGGNGQQGYNDYDYEYRPYRSRSSGNY